MALKIAKVTTKQPNASHEALGIQAFETGELDRSAASFLAALEMDDQNAALYLKLGVVLLQQGKLDKALIAIKRSLELAPYEADAYNAMGSTLFHLELWGAADAFFKRAMELDPEHPTAKANLLEARKRLRGGDSPLPPGFESVMALLETKDPTVSLCMITKNEEQFIGDCLASVRDVVDEIILVDTGSTDRTVEIAESFGAKVFHFPWTGDFAAARNESLAHATGDWILVLDADETIPAEGHAELKQAVRNQENVGYSLIIENLLGEAEAGTYQTALIFRLFRNRPDIRYEGIIHEQALPSAQRTGLPVQNCRARIVHRGYLAQHVEERGKYHRNLEILKKQVEIEPEEPYVHFNLGQTYKLLGQMEEAAKAYRRSLDLLNEKKASLTTAYWPQLYFSFIDLYRLQKEYERALEVAEEALANYPNFPDILFTKGYVLLEMGRHQEAIQAFEACRAYKGVIFASGNDPSVPTYKSSQALGTAYSRMGQHRVAKQHFLRALDEWERPNAELFTNLGVVHLQLGELQEAFDFFLKAVEIDPHHAQAWLNIGFICQQRGQHAEAHAARQKAYELEPDANGLVFGTSLLHLKKYPEAEALFAEETKLRPGETAAWIYLGLARLCLGRTEEARAAWETLATAAELEAAQHEDGKALLSMIDLLAGDAEKVAAATHDARHGELWVMVLNHLLVAERYAEVERALAALQAVSVSGLALALGRMLAQFGLHEEALGFLLKAREEAPESPEVYTLLGEAAEDSGNLEDAQVMYQMALSLDPKLVMVRQRLGRLRLMPPAKSSPTGG